MSSMSRLRPAMSAPRRPTNATSPPSAAIQAAMLAPDPPPCMVTLAWVSLPRASGSLAWATASVIRSPMTTTRAILVITPSLSGPRRVRPQASTVASAASAGQRADQTAELYDHVTRHKGVIVTILLPGGVLFPGVQRENPPGDDQFRLFRLGRQRLIEPPQFVPEQPPGGRGRHHPHPCLVAHRDHQGPGLPPRRDELGDPIRHLLSRPAPCVTFVQNRRQPGADPVDEHGPARRREHSG